MTNETLKKIEESLNKLDKINNQLSYPEVLADKNLTIKLSKEKSKLETIENLFNEYNSLNAEMKMLNGGKEKSTAESLNIKLNKIESDLIFVICNGNSTTEEIVVELVCKEPSENSSLFLKNISLAYENFCEINSLNLEVLSDNKQNVKLLIQGGMVDKIFSNEIGQHIGVFGKNQTTLFVYAYKPLEEKVFNIKDVKIDVYRSNGAGGQNVNKVSTAIRATHTKTNLVCTCQDERSQFQNKERALNNLKIKVENHYKSQTETALAKAKKQQEKSAKNCVRTYNFEQNFVVDGKTKIKQELREFLKGGLVDIINNSIIK